MSVKFFKETLKIQKELHKPSEIFEIGTSRNYYKCTKQLLDRVNKFKYLVLLRLLIMDSKICVPLQNASMEDPKLKTVVFHSNNIMKCLDLLPVKLFCKIWNLKPISTHSSHVLILYQLYWNLPYKGGYPNMSKKINGKELMKLCSGGIEIMD